MNNHFEIKKIQISLYKESEACTTLVRGAVKCYTRIDTMKKEVYTAPKLEKVGNVKDLTRGGTGVYQDNGGAGSFSPVRPG